MKKFLSIILILFCSVQVAFCKELSQKNILNQNEIQTDVKAPVIKLSATFDWANMSQIQRDEKIQAYHNILFDSSEGKVYSKKEFKQAYKNYLKDENYREHYRQAKNGVTELEDAYLCGFYAKRDKDLLIMYALQFKNDMKHAYYYDGYGHLWYVDEMSENYPNFPYHSKQFKRNGQLKSAIVFENKDTQYMYYPDGSFNGLWYKDKMFDKKGNS